MNAFAATVIVSPGSAFENHEPLVFNRRIMTVINEVFDEGTILKYLSKNIPTLSISHSVMDNFGATLTGNLKGVAPELSCVEFLRNNTDTEFYDTYGSPSIFTPSQFWNSVIKIAEHERMLLDQNDSILGEDTHGVVFIVEKVIKNVPKRFLVNYFRERCKDRIDYRMMLFEYGGMCERGHYFMVKNSP